MRWRAILVAAIAAPLCLEAELLPVRWYTAADGLPNDEISRIYVDSLGYVWFCTPEGLARFDGYRFVNFGVANGLPSRHVNALLETRERQLFGSYRWRTVPIYGALPWDIYDLPCCEPLWECC